MWFESLPYAVLLNFLSTETACEPDERSVSGSTTELMRQNSNTNIASNYQYSDHGQFSGLTLDIESNIGASTFELIRPGSGRADGITDVSIA